MDRDTEMMHYILCRLPQPKTLAVFARLRREGWDWDDIADHLDGLGADLAEDHRLPFSNNPAECERYARRILIAAFAAEAAWMN